MLGRVDFTPGREISVGALWGKLGFAQSSDLEIDLFEIGRFLSPLSVFEFWYMDLFIYMINFLLFVKLISSQIGYDSCLIYAPNDSPHKLVVNHLNLA